MKYILVATYDCGCEYEAGWAETNVFFFDNLKEVEWWLKKHSMREFCHYTYPHDVQIYRSDRSEVAHVWADEKWEYICWNSKCKAYGDHKLSDEPIKKCPKCKKELKFVKRVNE